ncbi:MAG: hypothetical protein HY366_02800 [Candidatus Aenigmarchaeota archaeon]|nr:hypothetical protein [Candidatus Aenigmarchaeota archaeon]
MHAGNRFPALTTGKGQSAFELLGVALVGILLFVPLFFLAVDFLGNRSFETALGQARISVSSLSDAANTLCLQAQNSQSEVLVPVPDFIDSNNSSIANRTIKFALRHRERYEFVSASTKCDVNGSIPSVAGSYVFVVKREATLLNITQKAQ